MVRHHRRCSPFARVCLGFGPRGSGPLRAARSPRRARRDLARACLCFMANIWWPARVLVSRAGARSRISRATRRQPAARDASQRSEMTCLSKRARAGVGDARGWAKRARASAGVEAKLRFMHSVLDLGREGFARESSIRDDVRAAAAPLSRTAGARTRARSASCRSLLIGRRPRVASRGRAPSSGPLANVRGGSAAATPQSRGCRSPSTDRCCAC